MNHAESCSTHGHSQLESPCHGWRQARNNKAPIRVTRTGAKLSSRLR